MKASGHIQELAELITEHGDLEVVYESGDGRFSPSFEFEPGFESVDGPACVFLVNLGG